MKGEAVLTDEQKMVRFRNVLRKKPSIGTKRSQRFHSVSGEDLPEELSDDSSLSEDPVELKLYKILSWFDQSHRIVPFDLSFIEDLVSYHSGNNGSSDQVLSRSSFLNHLFKLESLFNNFAKFNEDFARVEDEALRNQMLTQNAPLFVQFVLCMYFGHSEGHKQIHFLLGHQAPSLSDLALQKVTICDLNNDLELFKSRALAKPYETLALEIQLNCSKPQILALVAHVLLFQGVNESEI